MWLINLMRNEETGAVKDFPSKYFYEVQLRAIVTSTRCKK